MRHIGDVGSGALLQEVEISHDCSVVETIVKLRSCSVATKNISGQVLSLCWGAVFLGIWTSLIILSIICSCVSLILPFYCSLMLTLR